MNTDYKFGNIIIGAIIFALVTGCGSSNSLTGARMDWSAQIEYDRVETSHVEPDQGSVLIGEGKNFTLYDGQKGAFLRQEPESQGLGGMFKSMAKDAVSIEIEGIEMTELFSEAERFSFAFLDYADAMVIFDYTSDADIIRMIDMTTGEELWKSEDYQWSLARYQNIASEVSKGVLRNIGLGAAAATAVSGAELTRERFAQNLIAPVPEQEGLLFRTTDGLLMLDARTAEVKWKMDDFQASGVHSVRFLEESNDLLFITYVSHLFDALQDSRQIMRVDATDGTVKWASGYQHSSRYIEGLDLVDNRILLRYMGSQAEVFDLSSGEVLVQPQNGAAAGMQRWVESQSDSSNTYPSAQLLDNSLYTINKTEPGITEYVRDKIARYDIESGEELWVSEPFDNAMFVSNIINYQDQLIATFSDADISTIALNKNDGSTAWSISDMEKSAYAYQHSDNLYLADSKVIRSVEPSTGKIINEVSLEEKGLGKVSSIDLFNDNVYLIGSKGVALYSVNDLEEINTWLPKGQIESSSKFGERLFVQTSPLFGFNTYLRVMNLNTGNQITEIKIEPGLHAWFGNFRNGVFIPNDGHSIYTMDEEKRLSKYSIIPVDNTNS